MKRIILLLFALVTVVGCKSQKTAVTQNQMTTSASMQQTIPTVEYEANTRGYYRKITISDRKAWVVPQRNAKAVELHINAADWNELVRLYQSVNKEGLKDLKAPTEKRLYDGAPMAHFRVITKETTYQSATFDGGFPPQEIEKIVTKIVAIGDTVE